MREFLDRNELIEDFLNIKSVEEFRRVYSLKRNNLYMFLDTFLREIEAKDLRGQLILMRNKEKDENT